VKLIVGLGNPDDKHAHTRHNIGFDVLEEYRRKHNLPEWNNDKKFKSEIIHTPEAIFIRPQTYMNNSGLAVQSVASYFKIKPEDILVVHDELDINSGHLKIRLGGSDAGHHGIESIINSLSTDKFVRLRLGIGNEKARLGEHKQASFNAEHYVLEQFAQKEQSSIKRIIKRSEQVIDCWLESGLEVTQNQFN
jgi:PTH1 family peptidyl-tRNA hydrolase